MLFADSADGADDDFEQSGAWPSAAGIELQFSRMRCAGQARGLRGRWLRRFGKHRQLLSVAVNKGVQAPLVSFATDHHWRQLTVFSGFAPRRAYLSVYGLELPRFGRKAKRSYFPSDSAT